MKEKLTIENNVENWLESNGFEYQIIKQLQSRTEWKIQKDGVEDTLSIPLETENIKAYMEQFGKQFETLKELVELRKQLK